MSQQKIIDKKNGKNENQRKVIGGKRNWKRESVGFNWKVRPGNAALCNWKTSYPSLPSEDSSEEWET